MIAVVPARGGSKGFPRKNLAMLAGKPLIQHTLECALAAPSIERVVVSTDDPEIVDVARAVPGVEVPFTRPAELASDIASAIDVYLHAGAVLGVDRLVALLPTAPLRLPGDIDASVRLFEERSAATVLSVTHAKPASWQQSMGSDGRLSPIRGLAASVANRQAYVATVIPNGAIYVLDLARLAHSRTYFTPDCHGYLMPADRSVDIDGPDDLRLAEAVLAHRGLSS